MKHGHILYEVIIVVAVITAVMIGYTRLSGKLLIQRVVKQDIQEQQLPDESAMNESAEDETPEPAEAPEEQYTDFLVQEAFSLFAYVSYHKALPAGLLPPSSNYPQVDPARLGEERILINKGAYTGYLPSFPLTNTENLCDALKTPSKMTVRVCGAEESCADGAVGQKDYEDAAFILSRTDISYPPDLDDSYTESYQVTVKNTDTTQIKEDAHFTLYGHNLLVVTSGQLADAIGCPLTNGE